MSKTPLELKTFNYWILQMHWNGRSADLQRVHPKIKVPNIEEAIKGCNGILMNIDPKKPIAMATVKFLDAIINKPEAPSKAFEASA